MPARAKLPPGEGKRVPLNMRTTRETREKLEISAAGSGRSLVQEVEHRVDQSFLDEEARDREWGGNKLRGLFRMMVGAADIIEARTGKSAFDDWETGIAVGSASKRLIHYWLPRPPAELIAEMERLSDNIPDAPERPEMPARGGLLVPRAPEEEWETYRRRLQKYQKKLETFLIECDEHLAAFRKILDEFKKAIGIGEEAALELLSDKKNRR